MSAWTTMFLGGVHCYILGRERLRDAAGTRVGLGFHPLRYPQPGGENVIKDLYQKMGAAGTAALRHRIFPRELLFTGLHRPGCRTLYLTGSHTAIRAGVATGTAAPSGLRD